MALRLYGAETQFYDETWKPDDDEKPVGAGGRALR
jgi:hypothetical protein